MIETAFEIFKLAGAGLVGGFISSFFSNRDHRHRKWWELRVTAYQNAIEALSDIVYYYDKHLYRNREMSEEFEKELDTYWDQSFYKVRRYADSGAFLFSDRVNHALQEFMKNDCPKYEDSLEEEFRGFEYNQEKARKCLEQLVECSKADLKLEPTVTQLIKRHLER